jgi:hypothetical protein
MSKLPAAFPPLTIGQVAAESLGADEKGANEKSGLNKDEP